MIVGKYTEEVGYGNPNPLRDHVLGLWMAMPCVWEDIYTVSFECKKDSR